MKKLSFAAVMFAVLVIAPVSALAAPIWTVVGTIASYEDYGVGPQLRITGDPATGAANPANCSNAGARWILPSPLLTASQLEHLQRVILAAHLAGRPISVKVSDTQCREGLRTYYAVSMP